MESRITQSFTEVNNLSHRHRIDIAKFFDLIRSTQSSISGGIVLQSILAEEWLDSDIDIYCHVSKVQTLVDFFKMNDNSHPRHEGRYPDLAVYNLMDQVITDNYYKVQLIVLKDDVSIPDFINTFDFDLNKVIYDGYRISSTVPLKKILSKEITFNSLYYSKFNYRFIDRIDKYRKRAFTVDFDPTRITKPLEVITLHQKMLKEVHQQFLDRVKGPYLPKELLTILNQDKSKIFDYINHLPQLREAESLKILSDLIQFPIEEIVKHINPIGKQVVIDPETLNMRSLIDCIQKDCQYRPSIELNYSLCDRKQSIGTSWFCQEYDIPAKPTYLYRIPLPEAGRDFSVNYRKHNNEFHQAGIYLPKHFMRFVEREEANYLVISDNFTTEKLWKIWPTRIISDDEYIFTYNWGRCIDTPFIINEIKLLSLIEKKLSPKISTRIFDISHKNLAKN